jgi:hypothetical protein
MTQTIKLYAINFSTAENYVQMNFPISGGYFAKHVVYQSGFGETPAIRIYDDKMDEVQLIIIGEAEFNDAALHEKI